MAWAELSKRWIVLRRALSRLPDRTHVINVSEQQEEESSPIRLTLDENDSADTMGRIVTAFERIADSLAKLAGLSSSAP